MTTNKTGDKQVFFLILSHSSSSATYKSNKKDYQAIKLSARERECEINCLRAKRKFKLSSDYALTGLHLKLIMVKMKMCGGSVGM